MAHWSRFASKSCQQIILENTILVVTELRGRSDASLVYFIVGVAPASPLVVNHQRKDGHERNPVKRE